MYYTNYTLQQKSAVLIGSICSNCGKKQVFEHEFSSYSGYSDKGAFRQKTVDKRERQAEVELAKSVQRDREKLVDRLKRRKYYFVDIPCSCNECGHRESWSRMQEGDFAVWAFCLGGVEFLLLIFCAAFSGPALALIPLPVLFAVLAVRDVWRKNKLVGEIRRIDQKNLPVVIETDSQLRYYAGLTELEPETRNRMPEPWRA